MTSPAMVIRTALATDREAFEGFKQTYKMLKEQERSVDAVLEIGDSFTAVQLEVRGSEKIFAIMKHSYHEFFAIQKGAPDITPSAVVLHPGDKFKVWTKREQV